MIRPFVDACEQVLAGEFSEENRELNGKIYEEGLLCLAFCAIASEVCDPASLCVRMLTITFVAKQALRWIVHQKFSAKLEEGEMRQGPKLILLKAKFDLGEKYGSALIPLDSGQNVSSLRAVHAAADFGLE